MTRRKPPPRTLNLDEERKIQAFLERAAPVVLESRVLNTHRWGQLVALAEELELSDEQLRRTVTELRERGVIRKVDIASAKPPPLPSCASSSSEDTDSEDHAGDERLQKVLASAGLGSRRQCEELITEGRVEINRQVVARYLGPDDRLLSGAHLSGEGVAGSHDLQPEGRR